MLSTDSTATVLTSELAARSRNRRKAVDGVWIFFWYIVLSVVALALALPLTIMAIVSAGAFR